MNTRSGWIRGALIVAWVVAQVAVPGADARGGRGGHKGGGHPARPPRIPAAHRSNRAPAPHAAKTPHASAPAHTNAARGGTHPHNANAGVNHAAAPAHPAAAAHANASAAHHGAGANAKVNAGAAGVAATAAATHHSAANPYSYTYGSGSGAHHYHAYGYGRGYRNRYYGGRSGYGRSQGQNRAIVSRLRSVQAGLARLDHDYQGHRVRAMHSIAMAVRQLSHRSMSYRGTGFSSGLNGGRGMRQGAVGAGAGRVRPMPQAQSDARMGQALRTLQGIGMQLGSQGAYTTGHARARGHVQRAIRELNTALSIR